MRVVGGVEITPVGQVESVCPSCGATLDQRPLKKSPCVHCGAPIYVRTRPIDGLRVLASDADVAEIEKQWAAVQEHKRRLRSALAFDGDHPAGQAAFEDFSQGREIDWVSVEETAVALLNERVASRKWGLVSISCANLAEMAALQGKFSLAIDYGLLRLTILAAGPRNHGQWTPGDHDLPVGAVRSVVQYFDTPDWLRIMKVMGEAVQAVAAWGGEPAWERLRDDIEQQMILKFGPQGALAGGL